MVCFFNFVHKFSTKKEYYNANFKFYKENADNIILFHIMIHNYFHENILYIAISAKYVVATR